MNARIATALPDINFLEQKIFLEVQKAQKEDGFLRGRQIAYMICEDFQVTSTHENLLVDFTDMMRVTLSANVEQTHNERESCHSLSCVEVAEKRQKLFRKVNPQRKQSSWWNVPETVRKVFQGDLHGSSVYLFAFSRVSKLQNDGRLQFMLREVFSSRRGMPTA